MELLKIAICLDFILILTLCYIKALDLLVECIK